MKKIAAIFTLLLAFTISAKAQESKSPADIAAKKDAVELTTFLGLTQEQQTSFTELFKQKHELMNNPDIPQARKTEMARVVTAKINASLTERQQQKLATNPELVAKLAR